MILTQDEIRVVIAYWRDKIRKNAGKNPNVCLSWQMRINELHAELGHAPRAPRPANQLLEALVSDRRDAQ